MTKTMRERLIAAAAKAMVEAGRSREGFVPLPPFAMGPNGEMWSPGYATAAVDAVLAEMALIASGGMHGPEEFQPGPDDYENTFPHEIRIYINGEPHVLQPGEWINKATGERRG